MVANQVAGMVADMGAGMVADKVDGMVADMTADIFFFLSWMEKIILADMDLDMVADKEVDKVADMVADIDVDTVADTSINIHINMEIQFSERFGHGGCLIGPKLFRPEDYSACASFKLCEFILLFSFSIFHFPLSERRLTKMFHFVFVSLLLFKAALAEDCFDYE